MFSNMLKYLKLYQMGGLSGCKFSSPQELLVSFIPKSLASSFRYVISKFCVMLSANAKESERNSVRGDSSLYRMYRLLTGSCFLWDLHPIRLNKKLKPGLPPVAIISEKST